MFDIIGSIQIRKKRTSIIVATRTKWNGGKALFEWYVLGDEKLCAPRYFAVNAKAEREQRKMQKKRV